MATEDIRLDGQGDLRDEPEDLLEQEHPGGGRFNRLILIAFAVVAIVSGVVVALGVESSGIGQSAACRNRLTTPEHRHATTERSRTSPRTAASRSQHRLSYRPPAVVADRASAHPTDTAADRPAVTRNGRKRST